MPNRIIKESICDSEKVAKMSDFQFRLWIGLITQADDAGRGDARPAILRGRIFPLREQVTAKQIETALRELATIGSVILYEVGGRPYYAHKHWSEHQRIRDVKPKYPAPEEGICQSAADCGELPQIAADCGFNPIQSESNPNTNTNPNICSEQRGSSKPPVAALMLNDGSSFEVYAEDVSEYSRLYPAVDIEQELRNMEGWCKSNPRKRKTASGIQRFIVSWLAREQNKPHTDIPGASTSGNPFKQMLAEGAFE